MGLQKIALRRPGGPRPPPKWSPTWASKIEGFVFQDPSWGGKLGSAWEAKSNFLEAQLRGEKMNAKNNLGNGVLVLVKLFSPAASPGPRAQT